MIAEAIEAEFSTTINSYNVYERNEPNFQALVKGLEWEASNSELVSCYFIPVVEVDYPYPGEYVARNDYYENVQQFPSITSMSSFAESYRAKNYFGGLKKMDDVLSFIYTKYKYINIYDHIRSNAFNKTRMIPQHSEIEGLQYVVVMFFIDHRVLKSL